MLDGVMCRRSAVVLLMMMRVYLTPPLSLPPAASASLQQWSISDSELLNRSVCMTCVYLPPRPTTALTCVLRCFPCEPTWAGSPFLHRPPTRPMVTMTRSKTFQAYLPSCHRTYSCIHCRAHLANHDELISKSFQGSQGRAYLFNSVVNVGCGPAEERVLLTGLHAVADIYCENCKTTLGWKYEHAFESSQKYKEGKFIIELAHMIKDNGWD
ncbi:protein yippee-like 2 isoform X1 [Carassius auratus]|uniref:Protein yippee-like 2 isoform X1 n=3 Tax=Cyprininae TaxID=2743694 RepID=A0A6P6LBG4_CARAU|nr:protein yippee-like 2 isoform X1 [Carassius auratus]XP_052473035.1 protein yippee-like 2 isoform X1 [Carassius gibelio]